MLPQRMLVAALLLVPVPGAQGPQGTGDHGALVFIMGQEPASPVPTALQSSKANADISDLLFLRLARPGPGLSVADEKTFEPQLARSWRRRDSLTLVFELDPRAKWHDGTPVTARDVVWTFDRTRAPGADPQRALLLRYLASATAETDRRVVLTFRRAYSAQFFDATYHVQPLPAHLVDSIPIGRFAASQFVRQPVGNGPYRWVRREPGRLVELAADPAFFLGAPKLDRVVVLVARDPEAQINLLLDGTADAYEAIPPVWGPPRIPRNSPIRLLAAPSFSVAYLLFNQRAYGDRSKPHPVLSDPAVRRAVTLAIDRATLVRSTFGAYAQIAEAPVAGPQWTSSLVPKGPPFDPAAARALLRERGWADRDGDGTLDKDGVPLALRLNLPSTSAPRLTIAPQVQEQLRHVGIRIDIVRLDGPVWAERRNKGEFDIDFSSATLDPSPSGIVQSWTCAGRSGSNVGQYCNPAVDSLLDRAIYSTRRGDAEWRAAYAALQRDYPAVFLASSSSVFAIHSRFRGVTLRPESYYADIWRWSVDPARRIARDGGGARGR
ncbi:MAG: peptide ABC transporter substrate-binding protein [Gemmatimonadales bacterium]|nr:peptide ABC transporter substrate-binding protein [Gemmatimonadales bacterium]